LSAEILKASGLRECTYGFDWCRSGYYYLEQFLSLDLEEFLSAFAYRPSIPLIQSEDPNKSAVQTAELIHPVFLYGFPYLYYPHRPVNTPDTKEYIKRSFTRLKNTLKDDDLCKICILSDYTNKPYASFLDHHAIIAPTVHSLLASSVCLFKLILVRIELSQQPMLTYMVLGRDPANGWITLQVTANVDIDHESSRQCIPPLSP